MAQRVTNLTSIHEDEGLIPSLNQWVKDHLWKELYAKILSKLGALDRFRMGNQWPERPSMIKWLEVFTPLPTPSIPPKREEGWR